jgi:hypothetical protein
MSGGLVIDGGMVWTDNTGGGVLVGYMDTGDTFGGLTATNAAVVVNGTMTMYNGVTIQNNYNAAGATAEGSGGGVSILSGGNFTIAGGTIEKNFAYIGGGVAINANNGTTTTLFTMHGGEIKTNLATNSGGGVLSRAYSTAVLDNTGVIRYNAINANTSGNGCGWHVMGAATSILTGVNKTAITDNKNVSTGTEAGTLQHNLP